MFALVDVNSFYASCEKVFRPDLTHKPIIVLSNNDGCVIARSHEAKKLGIKMGQPYFKLDKKFIAKHDIQVFSSNYALYADMSMRVMDTLESLVPNIEVYSIDEAFCDLSGMSQLTELEALGFNIKRTIRHYTHLDVGVGIAPTKTLAKLANYAAKHWVKTGGVVDLSSPERQQKLLALTPVNEVWGIGRRLAEQLKKLNIITALDLAQLPPKQARKQFSVIVERTVRELNGEPCLELENVFEAKKQIICSRSFGEKVTTLPIMREAICNYTVRAAEKLRQDKQFCKHLTVFIKTSPFSPNQPYYSNYSSKQITATNDTRILLATAQELLEKIWLEGKQYLKAGVILNDFCDNEINQYELFSPDKCKISSQKLMSAVDEINQTNPGKLFFAAQGVKGQWHMKQEHLSPAYTTRIKQIPKAKVI
ncbi:translesion error-prone DNA polymerase V subunit UmuC [Orbaceae bacterium ac157xtp]